MSASATALRGLTANLVRPLSAPRRPPVLDVVLAGAFVALTVAEAVTIDDSSQTVWLLTLAVPALGTLAVRRQYPLLVATVVTNVNWFVNPGNDFTTLLSLVLVSFTVGYETRPPRSWLGLGLVLVPFVLNQARVGLVPSDLAAALVFLMGPWVVGTGLARWWGLAAAGAAFAAFAMAQSNWPGMLVAAAFLGVVSLACARATDPARQIA